MWKVPNNDAARKSNRLLNYSIKEEKTKKKKTKVKIW